MNIDYWVPTRKTWAEVKPGDIIVGNNGRPLQVEDATGYTIKVYGLDLATGTPDRPVVVLTPTTELLARELGATPMT